MTTTAAGPITRRSLLALALGGGAAALVGVDPAEARVKINSAPNFRHVVDVPAVWRSDDLDGINAAGKRAIVNLNIRTMIALNSGGDPHIPGVRNVRFVVTNNGSHVKFYRRYITDAANRKAIGKALREVAHSKAPVVIHCKGGKDRTGWVCDLLQTLGGVPTAARDADYLRSPGVHLSWLNAARGKMRSEYGTVDAYLRACGLDAHTVRLLRARVQ